MSAFKKMLGHLDPQTRLLVRAVSFGGRFIRAENENSFHIARDPTIFVFNHNNYWETLLIGSYFLANRKGKKLACISDWMFGHLPLFAWLLKRIDPVYTYRKTARFAFLHKHRQKVDGEAVCQACLERLQNGQSLGIFPEGTRNHDPFRLQRGRKGVGEIAIRSAAPVLPVGIDFPQRSRKGRTPWFSPIILRFGTPFRFPEEGEVYRSITRDARLSPRERQRLQVFLSAQVTHRIMLELARLSGKTYPFAPPKSFSLAQSYRQNNTGKEHSHDDREQGNGCRRQTTGPAGSGRGLLAGKELDQVGGAGNSG
jgi:1-acyl-sn-glycerol-3-phosphate acyltransferase